MHKALRIFFFLMFIAFAYLQLNDLDPWLWVSGYLFIAIVSLLTLFIQNMRKVFYFSYALYTLWTLTILPEFIKWLSMGMPTIVGEMKATQPHIEFAREFFGLLICMLVTFYLQRTQTQIKNKNT